MKESDFNAYNSVWDSPTVTSFFNLFPDNYDKEILEFWRSRLIGPASHVIDLACGNGALAWIANDLLNGEENRTRVTGVDAANIDPFRVLGRSESDYPAVRFIGNTPIEKLPFADDSVDHVISQYGLEYASLTLAMPEIDRVLSGAGRVSLILHDDNSSIVRGCINHLDAMRLVIGEIRLHEDLLDLIDIHESGGDASATSKSATAAELTARVNRKIPAVQTIALSLGDVSGVRWYLDALHHAIKEIPDQQTAKKRARVEEARDTLVEHIERLEALDRAALNIHRRHYLLRLLDEAGLEVTENRELMYDGDTPVGTVIAAERRSGSAG